jgi:hypothetical protein
MAENGRTIRVEASLTVNLGDYSSAKVSVGAEEPVAPGGDRGAAIDDLFDALSGKVFEHVARFQAEADRELGRLKDTQDKIGKRR